LLTDESKAAELWHPDPTSRCASRAEVGAVPDFSARHVMWQVPSLGKVL